MTKDSVESDERQYIVRGCATRMIFCTSFFNELERMMAKNSKAIGVLLSFTYILLQCNNPYYDRKTPMVVRRRVVVL